MTTSVQRALARGVLLIGRLLGVGGDAWEVLTPTGNGITGARTYTLVETWRGYVLEQRNVQEAGAATGAPVGRDQQWEAVGADPLPAPGTLLRSVAQPTLAFSIIAPDVTVGYYRAILRPADAPSLPTPLVLLDLGTDEGVTLAIGIEML